MRLLSGVAWLALFTSAGFTFLVERGYLGRAVAPDLTRLPAQIGTLEVLEEIPLEPGALGSEPPERYAFRRVRDARGEEGRLFVAYYARAQRWSGRPHDVEKCYAALGWQEREARHLSEAHRPWSRLFEREGETIRVVHWLEHPGPDEDQLDWRQLGSRLSSARGFRPDVASVYLEFPAEAAPSDAEAERAVGELSLALESLW
jgi:hypothetical protein